MTIIEQHAAYLRDQAAITPDVAEAAGIRSAVTVDDLPEWARERRWAEQALPAIVFPWRTPSGDVVEQVRPDTPIVWDDEQHKYLWPRGAGAVLNAARPVADEHDTVLIVEGTKQTFAAAAYAPANVAVYGVGGCRNWSADGIPLADLAVVEDRRVVVALDADAATNLDVYTAGMRIAEACAAEGAAEIGFLRLAGVGGSNGLDDVLAKRAHDKRASYLARLIAAPKTKPADAKPRPKKPGSARTVVTTGATGDRPQIYVDGDRLDVINQLTGALLRRWNATRMFDHGGVLSILATSSDRGQDAAPIMKVLDKRTFIDLVQETAVTVRRAGTDGEGIAYCYPEVQTMDALLSRHQRFAPLDRIARVPFVRADGSICQANGYDEASRTLVVLDESVADLHVSEDPSAEDLARAVKLIREEWMYDFFAQMPSDADRANAVALALTPFIRGLVDVVPLAVVDGIGMGVGKNLFADTVMSIPATGAPIEPLGWQAEDEENRKAITSAFRESADVMIFDEAHVLFGNSLARALTAVTWKDRQLGANQILGFRNTCTWVALGNNVRIEGDILRRVYRIAIRPNHPSPMDRPASDFRIPNIREWAGRNRAELVHAMLTLIRSWYAAGQPVAQQTSFGSFERWERIVGGILHHAGFSGFLANTKTWRAESSHDAGYWTAHVHWLLDTFGSEVVFTCAQVRDRMTSDPQSEPPPGLTDLTENPRDYNRKLGQAYHRMNERYFDGVRLVKWPEKLHDNKVGWMVVEPESDGSGDDERIQPMGPNSDASGSNAGHDGGAGGIGGISPASYIQVKNTRSREHTRDAFRVEGLGEIEPPVTPDPLSLEEAAEVGHTTLAQRQNPDTAASENRQNSGTTAESRLTEGEEPWEGVEQPSLFAGPATPAPLPYTAVDLSAWTADGDLELPEGVLVFDIESGGPDLWPVREGFIRITGVQQGRTIRVYDDATEVADLLRSARLIIGHNLMSFDLLAFALHHGVDIHELAEQGRLIDTMLTENVVNPPEARTKQGRIMRQLGLDALGAAKELGGKSHDLGALAKEFGGYDQIPVDDERYVAYCAQDVNLTTKVSRTQERTPYAIREHRIAAIAAQIRLNGFRVDVPLLRERVAAGETLRAQRLNELQERYGLPMTLPNGKPAKSPHATKEGKAAIERAFIDLGVQLGRTKSGGPAFGKEARDELLERYAAHPDVLELLDTVGSLLGIRTVYGTVERCLIGDRVHPDITMFQASGRWSITEPGLTVMGKRGGKYVEREVFLPEPGHVIVSADLSQVDARAVAAWCQDPAYLDLFGPGRDSHDEIAATVWGDAPRGSDGKHPRREDAKILGHGWNYGMGIAKLAAKIGNEDTAREFDRAMKERYPGLVAWKQDVAAAADGGHLLDNGFGRLLRTTPGFGWTQGPALMGQSAARDILMHGLLRMPRALYPYLRAVVHDEVVMSIPADQADEIEAQVMEALAFQWAPREDYQPVQIEAGLAKRGVNWGSCYAY